MNKQPLGGGIEWTQIDGRPGYTWNPTAGCLHGCTWQMPDGSIAECYAKTIVDRFRLSDYNRENYPNGFEHHYWNPERLAEPAQVKKPAGIFVGSMADLFGHWVPTEQINAVLSVARQCPQHTFMVLTKNPLRLAKFNPFPDNVWVGCSIPAGHLMKPAGAGGALWSYLRQLERVRASVRFLSIEPLWFDVAAVFDDWLARPGLGPLPFEWAIIGAASNGARKYQPEAEWVHRALRSLDGESIPVFYKSNLDWTPRRREWPRLVKVEQLGLFD